MKYFLAPMQDGQFKFGESMYTVGKAVFVFAGGVTESYRQFRERAFDQTLGTSKARDFVSRLRGYLDIRGISAAPGTQVDTVLMLRRAIILRELIRKNLPEVWSEDRERLQIDPAVSRAFLETRTYTNDTRSMEAILQMARVAPPGSVFQRSWIPAREQLAMHVDAEEFLRLLSG